MLAIKPPKDLRTNLDWRNYVRGRGDTSNRDRARILERCKYDADFFIDSFVWQYNPADENKVGPFILRKKQSEVLGRTAQRMFRANSQRLRLDTIWRKSREEGASWMALILFVQRSLFWAREKFLCVSHTADAVDKSADPDSLFWKIDHIHEHLPEWMDAPKPGVDRLKMRFWYPKTKSSITGAASSGRSGVGGRATGVLLDELAKQKDAHEIISQTADTGPRLMVSTFYGTGDAFYMQCQRPDVYIETLHWTDNPEKAAGKYRFDEEANEVVILDKKFKFPKDYRFDKSGKPNGGPFKGLRSPWYDAECMRRQSDRDVAMHLDINPEGAARQFFDGSTINRLVAKQCRPPEWEGDLTLDLNGYAKSLTKVAGGPFKLWVHPKGQGFPRGRYGMGADIAAGTGATPSCLSIGDADLCEKIGHYSNAHISPERFAEVCFAIGHLFRDLEDTEALFAWEMAGGVGEAFGKRIMALGYSRVYYREAPMAFAGVQKPTDKPGWYPREDARRVLLEAYRTALGANTFLNPSEEALLDTLRFAYTQNGDVRHAGETATDDPTAARVNHGDLVIADALCLKMLELLGMGTRPVKVEERGPPEGSFQWRFERGQKADREAAEVWV